MNKRREQKPIESNLGSVNAFLDSKDYQIQKRILSREIQGSAVVVDRECFKKNAIQKAVALNAKKNWKKEQKELQKQELERKDEHC